jgi:hypothetical protein
LPRALAAEDAQPAARFVNRREEGQTLNMVPVRVRNEQGEIERALGKFREERPAQSAQARAGVEDDDVGTGTDFDAGGVAAVTDGARPRRGNRAANAPEFYGRGRFDAETLAHSPGKIKLKIKTGFCHRTGKFQFYFRSFPRLALLWFQPILFALWTKPFPHRLCFNR